MSPLAHFHEHPILAATSVLGLILFCRAVVVWRRVARRRRMLRRLPAVLRARVPAAMPPDVRASIARRDEILWRDALAKSEARLDAEDSARGGL